MTNPISEERLRNTLAWATARLGQLSGAEVIVGAITELLERRVEVEKYKAWAAACDEPPAEPDPTTGLRRYRPSATGQMVHDDVRGVFVSVLDARWAIRRALNRTGD